MLCFCDDVFSKPSFTHGWYEAVLRGLILLYVENYALFLLRIWSSHHLKNLDLNPHSHMFCYLTLCFLTASRHRACAVSGIENPDAIFSSEGKYSFEMDWSLDMWSIMQLFIEPSILRLYSETSPSWQGDQSTTLFICMCAAVCLQSICGGRLPGKLQSPLSLFPPCFLSPCHLLLRQRLLSCRQQLSVHFPRDNFLFSLCQDECSVTQSPL